MAEQIVKYTSQEPKFPSEYSLRVGPPNPGKALNIQKFSPAEVALIKAHPIDTPINPSIWRNIKSETGLTQHLYTTTIKSNQDLLKKLLPNKFSESLQDYEVAVLFLNTLSDSMKACIRNKVTGMYYLTTATNVAPAEKHTSAIQDGWFVYNSHMVAPISFYYAFKEAIL
jgi:hypothetical protein